MLLFRALKDKGGEKSLVSSPGKQPIKDSGLGNSVKDDGLSPAEHGGSLYPNPSPELWTRKRCEQLCFAIRPLGITPASAKPPGRVQTPCT